MRGGGTSTLTASKPDAPTLTATSQSDDNAKTANNDQNNSQSNSTVATPAASSSADTAITNQATATSASSDTNQTTTDNHNGDDAQTTDQGTQTAADPAKDASTAESASSNTTKVNKRANNELKVKKATSKKLTKYNKQSAQKVINQANKLMKATQKQIAKGNSAASAKAGDNIPQDDALTALGTHQKAQRAKVLKTVRAAQKIAIKNKKQATNKLNAALSLVTDMHDTLNQATALVAADKKGVKAHVVANAKAAYNQVGVPNGTSARVDDYGDLIITASNAHNYNQVLKTIHKQGLTGSFRQIVDPAQAASLTLSGPNGASAIDADGNMTIDQTKANALSGSTITATFNISGNKGDTFFLLLFLGT
ncbi:hypothetical protein [Lentilactobacillus kisonensis]|uniref:hypothetical protein n=1 Tax=Lentilactobacillus kisonensis TaxID=481722 RepID=UPI0006D17487|nr:hypothetical protein [Lentilactobacillus kisonensis]